MKKVLTGVLVGVLAVVLCQSLSLAADPPDCSGYPESRVWLDAESWWSPQPLRGGTGHIHVGACVPLFQPVTGTVHLDLKLQLHHLDGEVSQVRVKLNKRSDGLLFHVDAPEADGWTCAGDHCEQVFPIDVPVSEDPYDGWRVWYFRVRVDQDGSKQLVSTRYPIFTSNGREQKDDFFLFGATGWYTKAKYSEVMMDPLAFPLGPVSGVWLLPLNFGDETKRMGYLVTVDPDFHATPEDRGTIIEEVLPPLESPKKSVCTKVDSPGSIGGCRLLTTVAVDTTTLSNGWHTMFIQTTERNGTTLNSGALVFWFNVAN